jgi:hypothetical protein
MEQLPNWNAIDHNVNDIQFIMRHLEIKYMQYVHENKIFFDMENHAINVLNVGSIRLDLDFVLRFFRFKRLRVFVSPYKQCIAPHLRFAATEGWNDVQEIPRHDIMVFTLLTRENEHLDITLVDQLCSALIESLLACITPPPIIAGSLQAFITLENEFKHDSRLFVQNYFGNPHSFQIRTSSHSWDKFLAVFEYEHDFCVCLSFFCPIEQWESFKTYLYTKFQIDPKKIEERIFEHEKRPSVMTLEFYDENDDKILPNTELNLLKMVAHAAVDMISTIKD